MYDAGKRPAEIIGAIPTRTPMAVYQKIQRAKKAAGGAGQSTVDRSAVKIDTDSLAAKIQARFLGRGKHLKTDVVDLADAFDVSPKTIRDALDALRAAGSLITLSEGAVFLAEPSSGGVTRIDPLRLGSRVIKFGFVTDKHLNSRYERLDILNCLYETFADEGITTVYDAGNWIDGEARFNKNDILYHGKPNQLRYWAKVHPRHEGMTTHFIAGEDHEGWYTRQDGSDIGREAENVAIGMGRDDLRYLGFMEHDVVIPAPDGDTRIRIIHPGGGSSYAISYTTQKLCESLGGGEKPEIQLIGHYHKAEYLHYRNIHNIQGGCTCDQTPFMRKLRLSAHLGGWIVEATQANDGSISRIKTEWINFYDREYYSKPWEFEMYHPDLKHPSELRVFGDAA
jgi:hypothetical protein